ncbi:uncharacterized protein BO97DRAFT_446844 [Aspergillus homomorphus CBS 101889]|uniref:Uncharacterized protein n=1 Tax=Aspergillus homomorphus (strain CBS 101889) TaxID=1450537 RepID=A0A395HKM0_ASPHC|nr:hypothetical protein BO97DRAFT_446844 [Aspergillus homomorphus CBS 101889]RAL07478.1 hypothetical protein BO97DRAFT_446844 [Aspergillus homomorphus CBS 101889]
MFQSRVPLLRYGRGRIAERPYIFVRCFSATHLSAQANAGQPGTRGLTTPSTSNSTGFSQAQPRRSNIPPARLNPQNAGSDRHRFRRVVDARSLAASRNGSQPTNIIRGPRLRTPRNVSSARTGGPKSPMQNGRNKSRQRNVSRGPHVFDTMAEDAATEEAVDEKYRELAEQARPVPIRYDPEPVTMDSLKETWPSLPTDVGAHAAGVAEKLSSLSARFAHGYVSPSEMGRRLFQGKYVRFLDDAEKSLAVAEAQRLSQELAEKLSQRKGDLVDPNAVTFNPIDEKDRKALIELLVKGKYPKSLGDQSVQSPILDRIAKNLKNNGTYSPAGKDMQFFAKVESLLTSGRPTNRV